MGALGVKNLASKLVLTLLPPNDPFARLLVNDVLVKTDEDKLLKSEIEKDLATIERALQTSVDGSGDRPTLNEAFRYLVIGGNYLLYDTSTEKSDSTSDEDSSLSGYPLWKYVVKRNANGEPIDIIIKERFYPEELPEDFIKLLIAQGKLKDEEKESHLKSLFVYTWVSKKRDNWTVYQECEDITIPDSEGTYPLDACPWLPLCFSRAQGEDYGRSYVENLYGDLATLNSLSQALTEGSVGSAKLIFLVKPGSLTAGNLNHLTKARNGEFVLGNKDDVSTLQTDKFYDFRIVQAKIEQLERSLSRAFLLGNAVQRDAERVTAEEIRFMITELESVLGGDYSLFAKEFQLPFARLKLNQLKKKGLIPELPKDVIKISIVTGLEALKRNTDFNKLFMLLTTLRDTIGPEVTANYIHVDEVIQRFAIAAGIDPDNLLKSKEEIEQEMQQAQAQEAISQFGPQALDMVGKQMEATTGGDIANG